MGYRGMRVRGFSLLHQDHRFYRLTGTVSNRETNTPSLHHSNVLKNSSNASR